MNNGVPLDQPIIRSIMVDIGASGSLNHPDVADHHTCTEYSEAAWIRCNNTIHRDDRIPTPRRESNPWGEGRIEALQRDAIWPHVVYGRRHLRELAGVHSPDGVRDAAHIALAPRVRWAVAWGMYREQIIWRCP